VTDIKAGMFKMVNVICYHGIIFADLFKASHFKWPDDLCHIELEIETNS
jgi:hypothetical protein